MKLSITAGIVCLLMIGSCDKLSNKPTVQDIQLENIHAVDTSAVITTNAEGFSDKPSEQNKFKSSNGNKSSLQNPLPPTVIATDWDKKIIKIADIGLELKEYKTFNTALHSEIKKYGAYISKESQQESDNKIENTVTIKVPVDQFDNLVNSFSSSDIKVITKNISAEDVTAEAIDTKARMQARIAVRDRYIDLLKQARNMKDILEVQGEINSIQEDVEAADSRLGYLKHASAYSTVNLNYFQFINGSAGENSKPDFVERLSKAFHTGTTIVANLTIIIISMWPLLIALIGTLIFIRRRKTTKAIPAANSNSI